MSQRQPYLRLVKSGNLDLCSMYSATAASPRGSAVRSLAMSLTVVGAKPTNAPICANVKPVDLRSLIRDDQVDMHPTLRESVTPRQRLSVMEVRDNQDMPRPKDMPADLDSAPVGKRVRWWREHKKISRQKLAKQASMAETTLSDLENCRQEGSRKLHLIAAALGLNPHYLETGKGEPEAAHAQEPPPEAPAWPFPGVSKSQFDKLNMIERKYAETRLMEALAEIEAERRKGKRA
jgi:transcriptional regulator with XRE-family HTH domain